MPKMACQYHRKISCSNQSRTVRDDDDHRHRRSVEMVQYGQVKSSSSGEVQTGRVSIRVHTHTQRKRVD